MSQLGLEWLRAPHVGVATTENQWRPTDDAGVDKELLTLVWMTIVSQRRSTDDAGLDNEFQPLHTANESLRRELKNIQRTASYGRELKKIQEERSSHQCKTVWKLR